MILFTCIFFALFYARYQCRATSATTPAFSLPDLKNPFVENASDLPVKKVAIIGCGIAGLSLAHSLSNNVQNMNESKEMDVSIFEARSSLNFKDGSGIQLNGGMSMLHKINPKLHGAVVEASLPLKTVRSRAKPWFENGPLAPNAASPYSTLLELDIAKSIEKVGGVTEEELFIDGNLQCYTMMRGTLQETLFEALPKSVKKNVQLGMDLVSIEGKKTANIDSGGIMCSFSNGMVAGPFDLVVGCDGIKSAVKDYVDNGRILSSSEQSRGGSAIYSGIRIQFAISDGKLLRGLKSSSSVEDEHIGELRQYFGDGSYALSGRYGAGKNKPPTKAAFLIFQDENYFGPFKRPEVKGLTKVDENADWTQDKRSEGDARNDCMKRIQKSGLPDFEVAPVINAADRFFELGIYFHNPFSLQGWNRQVPQSMGRYCVLSGDAAHAMPPFLGQGANQAVQDAYCLASKVFAYNQNLRRKKQSSEQTDSLSIRQTLRDYEKTRWWPTANLTLKAALLGYLETGGKGFLSGFRDLFFTFAGKTGIARKVFLDGATPKI